MNNSMGKILVTVALVGALCAAGGTREAAAEISVNINLGPPPIVVAEPPAMVLLPDLQVYFVPHPEIDVFFYAGYWWSPRGNSWYRARAYNGPWGVVERRHIPAAIIRVPPDYRGRYEKEQHIPYGQWKKQHNYQGGKGNVERKEERQEHKKGHGRGHK